MKTRISYINGLGGRVMFSDLDALNKTIFKNKGNKQTKIYHQELC